MTKDEAKQAFLNLSGDEQWSIVNNMKLQIEELERQLAEKNELAKMRTAERFAPSSEAMPYLFQEIEILAAPPEDVTVKTVTVKEHTRTIVQKKTTSPANTPVYEIDHTKDAPESFEKDGITYIRDGVEVIEKLAVIPRKTVVEKNIYPSYTSRSEAPKGKNRIVLMHEPKTEGLGCAPSLAADIAVKKFDDHLPLYRQEEIFRREGLHLTRQKMASWMLKFAELVAPLLELMKKFIYSSNYIAKDETKIEVLDFRTYTGTISQSSWMYINIGSTFSREDRKTHSVVLVEYIQSRSEEQLLEDYRKTNYSGFVMTDGLKPYFKIEGAKHAVCWVHAVRDFKQILKANKKEANAKHICDLAGQLYTIEDKYRPQLENGRISPEEFLAGRKSEAEPVIDGIYAFATDIRGKYSPTGAMGKALNYLFDYREYMKNYLDCVEATPDNNACERVAKAFATSRKNWLFAKSVDGADASAALFSLIETAKLQGIQSDVYLEFIFTFAAGCKTEEDWEALLPWNADLSRLNHIKEARALALPDPDRKDPYYFTGLTGQSILKF